MRLTVNNVNLLPYIVEDGIEWSRNDVEAPDAGRTLDGVMWRGRVATKIKLKVTFMPLDHDSIHTVLTALQPEYLWVEYDDPLLGWRRAQMYSNNITAKLRIAYNQNTGKWAGFSIPLIER